jgi:hypothetical protein
MLVPTKSPSAKSAEIGVCSAGLPSFCKPLQSDGMLVASKVILAPDDPLAGDGIDYWAVEGCGDDEIDRVRGETYADEALAYARLTEIPQFVDLIITWMAVFALQQGRQMHELGALEKAFIDTAISQDPALTNRFLERFRTLHPHLWKHRVQ